MVAERISDIFLGVNLSAGERVNPLLGIGMKEVNNDGREHFFPDTPVFVYTP